MLQCDTEQVLERRFMKQTVLVDRRSFVKGMLAAGATVTIAACAPAATPAAPAAPVAPSVVGPAWVHPKSVVREGVYAKALGGPGESAGLKWKYGDSLKWLPPEKIPAGAASDLFATLPKDKHAETYRRMQRCRQWERMMKDMFVGGDVLGAKEPIYGAFHGGSGEEAMAAVCAVLNDDDWVASTHRGHQDVTAKGMKLQPMTAEMLWRKTGSNKGYGGSMHLFDGSLNILGANGIVGAGGFFGAGAGWLAKVKGTKQVAVVFWGDSAQNNPYAFSAVKGASLYKFPTVFVIQNNFQGIANPIATTSPSPWTADYYMGLGIPCVVIDGNDVTAAYAAAKEAVERARAGEGPSVIEMVTWRWFDHYGLAGCKVGVDGAFGLPYRTDDEVKNWISREPIGRYETWLIERGIFTRSDLDTIKQQVKGEVDESVQFARASPLTRPEDGNRNSYKTDIVPATQFYGHPVVT